jgi:soluble lytic murein transglycosylase-like protein
MRACFQLVLLAGCAAIGLPAAAAEPPTRMRLVVRPDVRSGKLVRSPVVSARAVHARVVAPVAVQAPAQQPEREEETQGPLDEAIDRIARQHDVDPKLVHSVIRVESNYNPYAISSKGALGLMQLVPGTARRFGVRDVFNPVQNIQGGVKYLRYLLNLHGGNLGLALASYNAGEGAVAQYGGIPPYRETQNYVYQVWKRWNEAKRVDQDRALRAKAEPKAAGAVPAPEHNSIHEIVDERGRVTYISR